MVRRNNHLKIGRYHQHLHELLDMDVRYVLVNKRRWRHLGPKRVARSDFGHKKQIKK